MDTEELCYLSIAEASRKLRARELSPVELTQAHLERIQALDGKLNAYITVLADPALEKARAAERALAAGEGANPLQGIPIAVKDLVYTKDIRTTAGSKILADFFPEYDATVMEQLENVGAVLLGKLNMMEFAMGGTYTNIHYGATHNPWDLERIVGASSSGPGAAVAAGLAMGALGTDTGGSIRGPAHNCGIVGLKPTYGRVSRHGVVPMSWSMDHVGPMTRTVEDCGLMLQAVAGYDPKDHTSSKASVPDYVADLKIGVRGLRIGVQRHQFLDLEEEVVQAIDTGLEVLVDLGAIVHDIVLTRSARAETLYMNIVQPEACAYHLPWMRTRIQDYDDTCRTRLEQGLAVPASDYVAAQRERKLLLDDYLAVLKKVDVFIAPTASGTAPRFDAEVGSSMTVRPGTRRYNSPMNLTGLPSLVLPIGFGDGNMPMGWQIVGRPFDEATVLRVAYAYEQATLWHRRHPKLLANGV